MNQKSLNLKYIVLALAGMAAGVVVTATVMSRQRPAVVTEAADREPGHKDEHAGEGVAKDEHGDAHGEEHVLIKLTPTALKTAGIRVEPVSATPFGETLSVPGTVEVAPNHGAKVTPPAAGKVVRLLANVGDQVRQGQILAVLDSHEIAQAHSEERTAEAAVNQAEAGVRTAQAEIEQARAAMSQADAEIAQARTKLRSVESALAREKEFAATGSISQPSLQAAEVELATAQSELLQAETDLQTHAGALQRAERLFKAELLSKAELEQAQLEHKLDQSRVAQAKVRVANARRTLEREQKVASSDIRTRQAVQTVEAEVRAAEGDVAGALQGRGRALQDIRRAQKGEQAARTTLRGAQSSLASARANLSALEGGAHAGGSGLISLDAPISGTVTERAASIGQAVERASALFVIENLRSVLVNAQVPESDVARVRVGQTAVVTVTAYPNERFAGVVQTLGSRVDEKTRSLAVRVLVDNPGGRLRPDMFARVHLGIGRRSNALTVPASAITEDGGKKVAFVEEEGGFEERELTIGRTSGDRVEVLSGLKAGESVVVSGAFVLKSEQMKAELKGHAH